MGLMKKSRSKAPLKNVVYGRKAALREKLEPRILLDAAALVGADVVVDADVADDLDIDVPAVMESLAPIASEGDSDTTVSIDNPAALEVMVVDEAIEDYQQLISDIFPEQNIQQTVNEANRDVLSLDDGRVIHVYALNGEQAGIAATSQILQQYNNDVSRIHLL